MHVLVSIDDGELAHLRLLLDEVFGAEHFVACITWQKAYAPKSSARHFSQDHEYILVYARDAARWRPRLLPRSASQDRRYRNPDADPRGLWRWNVRERRRSDRRADQLRAARVVGVEEREGDERPLLLRRVVLVPRER